MKKIFFILTIGLFLSFVVQAQNKYGLPQDSQIIETQQVNTQRILILWMINPKKNPRQGDDIYSCPDYTRGSYYEGKTRISLVNAQKQKIINTVEIKLYEEEDSFDIPYLIERHYYTVPTLNSHKEGKPKIIDLKDFNGDGKAQEFALYEAEACQGLATTLIGYSEKQDQVIQYSIKLKTDGKTENIYWADYLFSKKPVRNSFWKYEIDYRGRAGTLDKYEFHYDKATESFNGILNSISDDKE